MHVQKQLSLVLLDLYASHSIQREVGNTLIGHFQGWNIWAVIFSSALTDFLVKFPRGENAIIMFGFFLFTFDESNAPHYALGSVIAIAHGEYMYMSTELCP